MSGFGFHHCIILHQPPTPAPTFHLSKERPLVSLLSVFLIPHEHNTADHTSQRGLCPVFSCALIVYTGFSHIFRPLWAHNELHADQASLQAAAERQSLYMEQLAHPTR